MQLKLQRIRDACWYGKLYDPEKPVRGCEVPPARHILLTTGPWTQEQRALYDKDGGHGMLFYTFEGELKLSIHTPNNTPNERPIFISINEYGGYVR